MEYDRTIHRVSHDFAAFFSVLEYVAYRGQWKVLVARLIILHHLLRLVGCCSLELLPLKLFGHFIVTLYFVEDLSQWCQVDLAFVRCTIIICILRT